MNKYRSYDFWGNKVDEFDAPTDEIALMMSKRIEPYPTKVTKVVVDKEVEIRPLG